MKSITINEAQKLANPSPVAMVCTENPDGSTNLAPVGWWTILSYNPGTIGFAMHDGSFTGEMVRRTGNAVITVLGKAAEDIIMPCGTVSGKDCNKVEKFGIALQKLTDCPIQIPAHTRIAIVGKLQQMVKTGDHFFYIFDVMAAYRGDDE